MAFLVYFTWKYALGAKDLKVVYNALGRSEALAKELAESREAARRKAFFLNAVSHDLRTPLNGLMLQAELAELALGGNDAATLETALAEIKASAKATAGLLSKLLELGRLESSPDENRLEAVALEEVIGSVIQLTAAEAEATGLSLSQRGAGDVNVVTDRLKLERILQNLVTNAVKFTKKGGVEVVTAVRGGDVEIGVIDTGIGIAAADVERLFQEFFQAHNHERDRRKGFGLGLAITRKLATQLGGDISVSSEVGVGSHFTIRLPRCVAQEAEGRPTAAVHQHGTPAIAVNA
jgi:signal transduction histidine kinase